MKKLLSFFIFFLPFFSCIKIVNSDNHKITMDELDSKYKKYWDSSKYQVANSATNESYLSPLEKKVYYYLNIARMNPQLFAATYASGYEGANGYSNNGDFDDNKKSLQNDLNSLTALPIFTPDTDLYQFAKCHAIGIGKKGLETHDRSQSGCPDGNFAECIDFGNHNALDIVMSLLIDAGVPSLGHRHACLGPYTKLGLSNQDHKKDDKCTVLDMI